MTNREIRAWYQERAAEISKLNEEWIARGISLEERAFRASQIRHDTRVKARSMMEDATEVEVLRDRDRLKYGNPDGPTFDQLVEEFQQSGIQQDEVYERIIYGAQATNRAVNLRFGIGPTQSPQLPTHAEGQKATESPTIKK